MMVKPESRKKLVHFLISGLDSCLVVKERKRYYLEHICFAVISRLTTQREVPHSDMLLPAFHGRA